MNNNKIKIINRFKVVIFLFFNLLNLLLLKNVYCQDGHGGNPGAFLRIGMGVRPMSMGGAFTAVANDVTATYWNPAGLNQVKNVELFGMYSIMSLNRQFNCFAFLSPIGKLGAFGFNWINFGITDITGRDRNGEMTNNISDSENSFSISFGSSFGNTLFWGGSFKYLTNTLADYNAYGYGYDLGFLLKLSNFLFIGSTFQDINSKIKWNTLSNTQEIIPQNNRIGLAIRPPNSPITLAFDYEKNIKDNPILHGGIEIKLINNFGIDIGYCNNSLTGGGFLSLPFSNSSNLEIQYALFDDKIDAPLTHRVSVLLKFLSIKNTNKKDEIKKYDKLLLKPFEGNIIKVVNETLGLIDIGKKSGVSDEMIFQLYRKINKTEFNIGEVLILRARDNDAIVKVITIKTGFKLMIGDKISN